MRTRPVDWLDTRTYEPRYGLQVFDDGQWKHAAENGKPCVYNTRIERDMKRAEFGRMKSSNQRGACGPDLNRL